MKLDYTIFESLHNPQGAKNTASWADVCRMLQDVPAFPSKAAQPLIKLGTFDNSSRGQGSSLTAISGVEIDYDAGNVTAHSAAKLLRQAGIECVICSTYTSRMDCPKWRVFAPTSRTLPAELRTYLVSALDGVLGNIAARESYTPKQTFFYGRNPDTSYVFLHLKGEFVDVALKDAANAAYLADKRAQRQREELAATTCLRAETQRNRKAAGRLVVGQVSPIDEFNNSHDVRSILKTHGYRESGKKFIAPTSQSGMAGVVILQGDDGRERAFSHHSNDPIADGLAHDAFDLFCILDHGGDEWAAIQAAAKLLTTAKGESLHSHNRNAYRQAQQAAKAQAALDKLKGVAV
ncbi:hypothetical protein RCF98_14350 [Thiothrix lacustris]|uniref:Uncharacterized protein n=1 Tax=Thiothrix lacustris TaxID=525917 RepID=A0ABY9MN91_9GAMM|nr:hypothetical protein [Thiothrix lacustris]WML90144.1 hypothetical protein RCF98_14350 [Thiothrix lacustris]